MQSDLTGKEFRYLLELVYIGNWVLNSIRGDDRFRDYDAIESKLFGLCRGTKMQTLVENWQGEEIPSRAYAEGGIHEAIACYEDAVFYELLAEELSRRDMEYPDFTYDYYDEIIGRMDRYMEEFRQSGVDKLVLEDYYRRGRPVCRPRFLSRFGTKNDSLYGWDGTQAVPYGINLPKPAYPPRTAGTPPYTDPSCR